MGIVFDTELGDKLSERLLELEADAVSKMPRALPYEQYQQSCGFIEALRQVREVLIPQIIKEIQESK